MMVAIAIDLDISGHRHAAQCARAAMAVAMSPGARRG
jgi:hypothetical protein